jgi:uncharacterized repeat protein (TIGR01451 family)
MHTGIIVVIFALFCLTPSVCAAYDIDDVQWDSSIDSKIMHWGDTVTDNGYIIEVADFDKDGSAYYVYINLYKGNSLVKHAPMKVGDALEYRDTEDGKDMRVIVDNVDPDIDKWTDSMQDPTAKIQVDRRGVPEFDITVSTDKNTYDPRTAGATSGMKVSVKVKNTGEADAEDLTLTVSGAELLDGELVHDIKDLDVDETSEEFSLRLKIPEFWEEKDIDITATVDGYDINDDLHTKKESEEVTINPKSELLITKSTVEDAYMGESIQVTVSMRNWGLYSISDIHVEDSVTDDFELMDNIVLEKDLSLEPDESVVLFEYTLRPINDGKFKLPVTTASFTAPDDGEIYEAESPKSEIQVDGPVIAVSQSLSDSGIMPGETTTIKVVVKNSGNRDANVYFSSEVPDGLTFVSGDMSVDKVLKDGKSTGYSFVVRAESNGTYSIPAAEGNFIAMEDYEGERISNTLTLVVGEQESSGNSGSSNSGSGSDPDDSESNSVITSGGNASSGNSNESGNGNETEPGFTAVPGILMLGLLYIFKRHR